MKKLLLLFVFASFAACSTDDNGLETQENAAAGAQYRAAAAMPDCNAGINGSMYIDVANGIQNPVVVFNVIINGSTKLYYKASVEIEMLADCEDVNSGSGDTTLYAMPGYTRALQNSLTLRLDGNVLPSEGCYRWRYVVEGCTNPKLSGTCITVSDWNESALF